MFEVFFIIIILAFLLLACNQRKRLKKVKLGNVLEIEFEKEVVAQKQKERKPKQQSSTFLRPAKRCER